MLVYRWWTHYKDKSISKSSPILHQDFSNISIVCPKYFLQLLFLNTHKCFLWSERGLWLFNEVGVLVLVVSINFFMNYFYLKPRNPHAISPAPIFMVLFC